MSSSLSPPSPFNPMSNPGEVLLKGRAVTRDGKQPKKRGPKPDTKPALTRRQELSRQAQRTHRERKEQYIKSLEEEVLRLKSACSSGSRNQQQLADENRQLRAQLLQNGLVPNATTVVVTEDGTTSGSNQWLTSAESASESHGPGSATSAVGLSPRGGGGMAASSPLAGSGLSPSQGSDPAFSATSSNPYQQRIQAPQRMPPMPPPNGPEGLDYNQVGLEFVLSLEKPCMTHLPWLVERSRANGKDSCGHALMVTCPPEISDEEYGDGPRPPPAAPPGSGRTGGGDAGSSHWTQGLTKADLPKLLDFSRTLDLNGETTPVMAWGMVTSHPRVGELRPDDFHRMAEELKPKVRCYGFGAVLEEFEVKDAINVVLSSKDEPMSMW